MVYISGSDQSPAIHKNITNVLKLTTSCWSAQSLIAEAQYQGPTPYRSEFYIPFLGDKVTRSYILYDKCHRFLTWPSLESLCIPLTFNCREYTVF